MFYNINICTDNYEVIFFFPLIVLKSDIVTMISEFLTEIV